MLGLYKDVLKNFIEKIENNLLKKFKENILVNAAFSLILPLLVLLILWISISIIGFIVGNLSTVDILNSVSSVLGGYLGFLGGIAGIAGAFMLFKYQSEYTKKEISKLNNNIIKELLIYTVSETERTVEFMIDTYISSYVKGKIIERETLEFKLLKAMVKGSDSNNGITTAFGGSIGFKFKYDKQTFAHLIECFGLGAEGYRLYEKSLITKPFEKTIVDIRRSEYTKLKEQIIEEFIKLEDNDKIVYYDNWNECIHNINEMDFEKKRIISIWLNLANKTICKINEERKVLLKNIEDLEKNIKDLDEDVEYLDDTYILKELYRIRIKEIKLNKDIIYHICNYINYRDKVIKILTEYFKENGFKTSTEILNEKFDCITIRE